MENHTASEISAEWLREVGAISPPFDRVATTLVRVIPEPDAWGYTTGDDRLVVVAGKGLWVATATLDERGDMTALTIKRFDLRLERVRATLSESYPRDSVGTSPEWRFVFEGEGEDLIFRAPAPDDSPIVFGSRLAEALDS
jgi:hypothetical protein